MIVCACCGAAIAWERDRMLCDACREARCIVGGTCARDSYSASVADRDRRERECEAFLREPHDSRMTFFGAIA